MISYRYKVVKYDHDKQLEQLLYQPSNLGWRIHTIFPSTLGLSIYTGAVLFEREIPDGD